MPIKVKIFLLLALLVAAVESQASLPPGWFSADIGNVGPAGASSESGGIFTVSGSGSKAVGFQVCYKQIAGDFEFLARVTNPGSASAGYASLIVLETLTATGRFQQVQVAPGGVVSSSARNNVATTMANANVAAVKSFGVQPVPVWIRIRRLGTELSLNYGQYEADTGFLAFPTCASNVSLRDLASMVCVGFAVNSGDTATLNTATFDNVSITVPAPAMTYETSWVGNSLAGTGYAVGAKLSSLFVNRTTDRIFAYGKSDEGDKVGECFDPNGNVLFPAYGIKAYRKAGEQTQEATAATSTYWYLTGWDEATTRYAVFRYDQTGSQANISSPDIGKHGRLVGTNGPICGLAANEAANELYVSDTYNNLVKVYDLNLTFKRQFTVTNANQIALDAAGNLWIAQREDMGLPGIPYTINPKVLSYTPTGSKLPAEITGVAAPRGLAVAADGKIWVCDASEADMRVEIYLSNGAYSGSFGDQGGIYSGTRGAWAPTKFNGPTGIGFDSRSNIYVLCSGQTPMWDNAFSAELFKFDPVGQLQWSRLAMDWFDSVCPDPASDGLVVHSGIHRHVMGYSQPPGQHWSFAAITVDPYNYPEDPRIHLQTPTVRYQTAIIRRINGQKFMYLSTIQPGTMVIYRFATNSEIAIPCGMMACVPPDYPTNYPASSKRWIWRDLDNDGRFDSNEYESIDTSGSDYGAWWVDANGNVWGAAKDDNTIDCFAVQGLDTNGAPIYNGAHTTRWAKPAAFTEVGYCVYEPGTDTLYIGGYTPAYPHTGDEGKQFGRVVGRYNNWRFGAKTLAWQAVLPYAPGTAGHEKHVAQCLDVAGDYVFVTMSDTAELYAYDKTTGAQTRYMTPGPEVGGRAGLVDLPGGMNAFRRANGEYTVFQEANAQANNLIFRWNDNVAPPIRAVLQVPAFLNGSLNLAGMGAAGTNYVLQATTNLLAGATWTPIATNRAGTNGVFEFTDPQATNLTQRFYRTLAQ